MTRFLVDIMPKKVEECPFAEYIQMTSKNKCMLQTGIYSRCSLECDRECEKLIDVEGYTEMKHEQEFYEHLRRDVLRQE